MENESQESIDLKKAKHLLSRVFDILKEFDYEPSDADEPASLFSGYVSEDCFYCTKNDIEKFLNKENSTRKI